MILRQTLETPVQGYWDGGKKQVFDWEEEAHGGGKDEKGVFVCIGSFSANHWFCVAQGKTEKQTLGYAKRYLKRTTQCLSTFEYINEE